MENTRYRILLVEDDKLDRTAFERLVENEGLAYDCTIVSSVSEVREVLKHEQFDIVISDYLLGDGTAFEVQALAKDTPIIMVTGAGDEEVATKALRAGASDYLIKDIERNYLKTVPVTIERVVEHKRLQEKLRLLSHAVMSSDDSIYITDIEDKIIFVNRAFCEIYGYQEEEILGKDGNVLWQGSTQVAGKEDVYRAVSGWEVGFFHKRKDGSAFPISLSRSAIRNEKGEEIALVAITRDISERMEVENEFRNLNQELKKQNRLKKEFAIAVCHQLLQLMEELKEVISDVTKSASKGIDSELRDNLALADKNVDRAKETVSDFLEMSQIDASKINVELNELSLRSVVSQVLRALSPLAVNKGIELASIIPSFNLSNNPDWDNIVKVLNQLVGDMAQTTPITNTDVLPHDVNV
ncbi:MAG: PAS domain S-box protein [Planctomycetes bacterium]|nr:PAS domain S-box protein [Planctomycetota bacterium]